jgi:Leucine-rich repeat (LRR) protein
LTVSNSKLTTLSGEWHMLSEVELFESLAASNNELTAIDDALLCVRSIKDIVLSHNQISELPTDISKLLNLERLDLSHNQIPSLPTSFGNLLFLKVLDLSHNQLEHIPPALLSLGALLRLDLSHNKLTSVPKEVSMLRKLMVLRLNDNQLNALPIEIGLLSSLEDFNGANNPYTDMPELAPLEGKDQFFRVLRNRLRQLEETRILLFNEKDTRNNVRFEINEEISDKPILTGCTAEKLIIFLTQVNPPGIPYAVVDLIVCHCTCVCMCTL